jgi:hypothetical protein
MKLPLCGLATEFLRNAIGASAVFLLLDSFVTWGPLKARLAFRLVAPRAGRTRLLPRQLNQCMWQLPCAGADGSNFHPGMTLVGGCR